MNIMQKSQRRANKRLVQAIIMMLVFLAVINTITLADSSTEIEFIKKAIKNNYIKELNYNSITGNTPEEIFKQLDKYSRYYSKEEFSSFLSSMSDNVTGIGIYIKPYENGGAIINEILENSPAARAGLQTGDIVQTVDGIDITKITDIDQIAGMIRGIPFSEVTLGIRRMTEMITYNYTIERQHIKDNPVIGKVIDDNIGYIRIKIFTKGSSASFRKALYDLKDKNIERYIIDLRSNGGGFLDEAVEICNELLSSMPIVHVKNREKIVTYMASEKIPAIQKGNILVLVDQDTASAAEIMALAIQKNKLGKVIGETTVGKGSVQRLYSLESGAGFKLTESYYLDPNKNMVEGIGVIPDYQVGDAAAAPEIKIVNQEYVPLRSYFKEKGYTVTWDPAASAIVLRKNGAVISMPLGEKYISINSKIIEVTNAIASTDGKSSVSGEIIKKVLSNNDAQLQYAQNILNRL